MHTYKLKTEGDDITVILKHLNKSIPTLTIENYTTEFQGIVVEDDTTTFIFIYEHTIEIDTPNPGYETLIDIILAEYRITMPTMITSNDTIIHKIFG